MLITILVTAYLSIGFGLWLFTMVFRDLLFLPLAFARMPAPKPSVAEEIGNFILTVFLWLPVFLYCIVCK